MPVKTAAKTAKTRTIKKSNNVAALELPTDFIRESQPDEYKLVERKLIEPSQTNPRKRFNQVSIDELAASIKEEGILEPLIVRPAKNAGYELVAGERRWRAAGVAGLRDVPCLVRNLTDGQVIKIQIHENLHREDVHPLDEAASYKFYMESLGMTMADLTLQVVKSPEYVHQRLKLNELISDAQTDFLDKFLPIGHAMEIAKHSPEHQKRILERYVYSGYANDKHDGAVPLIKLKSSIRQNIMLDLADAPFSKKATDLRPDGLPCTKCPERTGFHPTLFGEAETGGGDCCLNSDCYRLKTENLIQITRRKLTDAVRRETGDNDYHAPVTTYYYSGDQEIPEALGNRFYVKLDDGETCGFQENAVSVSSYSYGETETICRNVNCPQHGGKIADINLVSTSSIAQAADPVAEIEKQKLERRIRKEELFDVRVGAIVRKNVLKRAAGAFTGLAGTEPELLRLMVLRLWELQNTYSDQVLRVIAEIAAGYFKIESGRYAKNEVGQAMRNGKFAALDSGDVRKMAFLLIHGAKSQMFYFEDNTGSNSYSSQKEIKELAVEFGVDYRLLDAQERLAQAAMKNKDIFRAYLGQVEAGDEDAKIPRLWSNKWKAKD